ncbi:MAG: hypothetical protein WDZ94_03400 [Patescibacteria group bacterium]
MVSTLESQNAPVQYAPEKSEFDLASDVRDSYLFSREKDRRRRMQTLPLDEGFVYTVVQTPDGEKESLDWPEKISDFQDWKRLIQDVVIPLARTGNKKFAKHASKWLNAYVLNEDNIHRYFSKLNDTQIEVTNAHTGTTPFEHSLNVVKALNTNRYRVETDIDDPEAGFSTTVTRYNLLNTVRLRIAAIFHDLGKRFGANGDNYQDHAYFSSIIIEDFIDFLLTDSEVVEQMCEQLSCDESALHKAFSEIPLLIRYHHISELGDRYLADAPHQAILTPRDIFKLTSGKVGADFLPALTELSRADTHSIKPYRVFEISSHLVGIHAEWQRLTEVLPEEDPDLEVYLNQVSQIIANIESYLSDMTQLAEEFADQEEVPQKLPGQIENATVAVSAFLEHLYQLIDTCPSCAHSILAALAAGTEVHAEDLAQLGFNFKETEE